MVMQTKFDIPVNFTVYADNEREAEYKVLKLINKAILEYDMQNEITDHELFEFLQEPSCDGCGNHNSLKGIAI